MADITIPDVTVRTTSDGTGYPHDVATGTGTTPAEALTELRQQATRMITELAADLDDAIGRRVETGAWGAEVIDVRLVRGTESGADRWLAYGTLRSVGLSPLVPEDKPWRER